MIAAFDLIPSSELNLKRSTKTHHRHKTQTHCSACKSTFHLAANRALPNKEPLVCPPASFCSLVKKESLPFSGIKTLTLHQKHREKDSLDKKLLRSA